MAHTKPIRGTAHGSRRRAAIRSLAPPGERPSLRVSDILELVVQNYRLRNLRNQKNVRYPMAHPLRLLGAMRAFEVTTDLLDGYVAHRRREGAADASIRMELHLVSRGFKLAARAGTLSWDDVPDFPTIRQELLKVRRGYLREDEVRAICSHLSGDLADLILFLFGSAWRKSEATGLLWDWVDHDAIVPMDSKTRTPRIIPLAGEIAEIIERRRLRRAGKLVFHRGGDQPIGDFGKSWRKACAAAGVPRDRIVHDLRRSGLKRMVESGIDQNTAMKFSGHRDARTFARYQIVDLRGMVAAAERLHASAGRDDRTAASKAREPRGPGRAPPRRRLEAVPAAMAVVEIEGAPGAWEGAGRATATPTWPLC